jgi:phage terminase Nu1 subunit (DNA packaging protein)
MSSVSQSEFASLLGKDKSYVTRLKQAGRLVVTADGKVDVEKSRALIASTADPSRAAAVEARASEQFGKERAAPQDNAIGNSFQAARAINEKYKALTAKLEYEKSSGKLIEAGEARLFAADLAATFRAALEVLPDRLAPELVALRDTESMRAVLVENFEQLLIDLSDKIKQWEAS